MYIYSVSFIHSLIFNLEGGRMYNITVASVLLESLLGLRNYSMVINCCLWIAYSIQLKAFKQFSQL